MKLSRAILAAAATLSLAACSNGATPDNDTSVDFKETERIASADGTATSAKLFKESKKVVVAGDSLAEQWAGAQQAVEQGIPMLEGDSEEVQKEIDRLGAEAEHVDPEKAKENLPEDVNKDNILQKIVELKPKKEREGEPILLNSTTSIASAATARALGSPVDLLQGSDPRESEHVMENPDTEVLAVGEGFVQENNFDERLELAKNGEVAGGGGLVFPGRRMIALYGHPSGGALGVMGEYKPEDAVKKAEELVAEYQPMESQPVIPAFEIIATVAAAEPGPDGDYSNEADPEELKPYIDAITNAGGYAVLDLQSGQADFLSQAKRYEELLKNPNVGLALDPEWRIKPGEVPMQRVGNVEASEINETSEWLANFVRENNLPQKALVLHQFQVQMIQNREDLNVDHPELAFVLHADGHGTPEQKFDTWNVIRQDLQPEIFMAWKNFFDEDQPMFTPEQTYNDVKPRPWFVSYQ
ncbi:hypothetical protein [Corynebacterium gerontici]|uniref:Cell wall binding repeat 2 n=1 Tax=Corynebacterium gerontici TaxID=2079234 RepID=A0A3G6J0B3_9CORY|nr:hypothetical protein [Corynebacterium gerontici]AZA10388.1 hypothetical protein CGERO_00250 [Corynebacterium gerontici]